MPETSSFHEHLEVQSEGGESPQAESALEGLLWRQDGNDNNSSGGQEAARVSENSKSPFINAGAAASSNEKSEQSAPVKGKPSDETIENLVSLFRDFLKAAPNPAASNSTHNTQQNMAGRKGFFGLNKGLPPQIASNNRYDYEQKYPEDPFGEENADNARVWLTYLDEAESFDRERVEGWKETADVLLVFAGLFSGVITTFVSQASQSLQQDSTQVSASLLFEIAQILRAQSIGTSINMIPNSTLTPTSRFIPTTHAFLVNGLWFTSLAITLSTALFAVLAKQWLYYYLTSITGTAHEKAKVRQLRFKGFELWRVGAIVDLLPILLHLAVGIFLMGIIILLFPLDVRVAWTIIVITGITYTLYFISVILPIRYPECPYTTSLTIYVGILFFVLRESLRWVRLILNKGFQAVRRTTIFQAAWRRVKFHALAVWRRITSQAFDSIQRLLHYIHDLSRKFLGLNFPYIRYKFWCIMHKFRRLLELGRPVIFIEEFPKFTNWREENIKKAVQNAAFLDFEALDWLYATSTNRSVRRIIARCVAVHPIMSRRFGRDFYHDLSRTLEVSETNLVDLRYGLCLDLLAGRDENWRLLRSIPDVVESPLGEAEYRSYSRIAGNVLSRNYDQILNDVTNNDLELPLIMWRCFFQQAPNNDTMAAHILICEYLNLFRCVSNPDCEFTCNAGVISFSNLIGNHLIEGRGSWRFDYLYRFFFNLRYTGPDYSPDKTFKTRYLLLVSIFRNLTSDQPFIFDKEQRQDTLYTLFISFEGWLHHPNRHISPNQYLAFFINICCADEFWSESLTDGVRLRAVECLDRIWNPTDTDMAIHFPFMECHDLSLIYQWYSRDLHPKLSRLTLPMFTLLLVPQNRQHLRTFLLNDPDAIFHLSNCFQNLGNYRSIHRTGTHIHVNLMDLLKSVNPKMSDLFTILYNSSVLVQLWRLLVFSKSDAKKFFLCVKSKIDQEKLHELYAAMTEQARLSDCDLHLLAFANWDPAFDPWPYALDASVCEFGQIIGVSHQRPMSTAEQSSAPHPRPISRTERSNTPHSRPMSTTEQSSVSEGAANGDHDIEERAQVPGPSESKDFHSIANWINKAFGFVWSKTRTRGAQLTSEAELQDL